MFVLESINDLQMLPQDVNVSGMNCLYFLLEHTTSPRDPL